MTQPISLVKRTLVVLGILGGLTLAGARLTAEPTPGKQDRLVTQLVCNFVQRAHLARPQIGDDLSRRLFKHFLKDLDPTKVYFLQSDVDEFKKQEAELDDLVLQGDMSFAYKVYERFMTRLNQRQKLIEELVAAPHDFTVKEYLETDYDKMAYPATEVELKERWRKRIKFDLLLHRIGEKPLPDNEARQKVLERYQGVLKRWKQVDGYELMELYLSDLTTSVDPHSSYMSPATLDDFDISMKLHLEGIGALLRSENGQTVVAELVPGGAAAADGRIKPNDKIVGVAQDDGKLVDVLDMKLRDVVKMIRGPRGTKVQLKIVPAGKIEPVLYVLTRQKIELKSQEARPDVIERGKKADGTPYRVGVIDLPSFYSDRGSDGEAKSATEDVRKILKDFTTKGVDAVVLDLRRNGGGSLREALSLTGLFIDRGAVVQVKGFKGEVQRHDDPERGVAYSGPVVVLVSRFSASASEILAGALQDYGRALVVGDPATHGKGTVQAVIDLGGQVEANERPKLGALKLTIQQFYRVNGDSTQNRGVVPDVVLPSLSDALATAEKELDFALAFDKVDPVEHADYGMVPAEVKAAVKARSAERVKSSADFQKLAQEVEQFRARKARKVIPLNEQELRDQYARDDAEKADKKAEELLTPKQNESAPYKFAQNFFNDEVLAITVDFLQAKRPARAASVDPR